jgi:hypothetical protein
MKNKFLALLITLSLFGSSPKKAEAVSIGFLDTDSICQQVQTLGAILNAFQVIQWPVAGFPGIVMGLSQRSSVIMEICDFVNQVSQLDTANAVFFSANYLNELTGNKWDDHLLQARKSYDLATSTYDFENGRFQAGLYSVAYAQQLNDYIGSSYHFYQKTQGKDVYLKSRAESEADMNQLAQLSYKRAAYSSAIDCPASSNSDKKTDLSKIEGVRQKYITAIDQAKEDIDFYGEKLTRMGPKFVYNENEFLEFQKDLSKLSVNSVTFARPVKKVYKEQTTIKTGKTDKKTGVAETKTKNVDRVGYVYDIHVDQTPFNKMKDFWAPKWKSYVKAKVAANGGKGILTGSAGIPGVSKDTPQNEAVKAVEEDFKDLDFECAENRLNDQLRADDPEYYAKLDNLKKRCKERESITIAEANGLLDYYSRKLLEAIRNQKKNEAALYTQDSQYLSIHRMVPPSGGKSSSAPPDVKCPEVLSDGDRQQLALKQQAVQNQLTEIIAENSLKEASDRDLEKVQNEEESKEWKNRATMAEEQNKNSKKALESVEKPFITEGVKDF